MAGYDLRSFAFIRGLEDVDVMKWINYSKYTGDDFGLSAEDLLKALSDFFLQSGFQNQYMGFSEWNQHTLEELKDAIQRALEQGETFDQDQAQRIQQAL